MIASARSLALILAVSLGLGSAVAQAPRYMVEMELWIDGEQRGTPRLVVEAGEAAELMSTDPDAQSGWKIELEVEPPDPSEGAPQGAIWLHIAVAELANGEWEHLTDTLLGMPEGQSSSLSLVEGGGNSDPAPEAPENSRLYLTVRSSLLRPGDD